MKKQLLCGIYECKKSLLVQKGLLIVLAGILLKLILCFAAEPDLYKVTYDTDLYKYYTEQYGGTYTEAKFASVEAELQKQQEIVASFHPAEWLSSEEYRAAYNRVLVAGQKVPVLEAVKERLTTLKSLQAYDAEFIYDTELVSYGEKFGLDWVCLVCVALLTVGIILGDYRCGMEQLLTPSKMGKRRIEKGKLWAVTLLSGLLAVLFYTLQSSLLFLRWDMGKIQAPIQSCTGFETCTLEISVIEGVFLAGTMQTCATIVFALVLALIARTVKNEVVAIVVAVMILAADALFLKESLVWVMSLVRWLEGLNGLCGRVCMNYRQGLY